MRVLVVGAGLAGLSAAVSLRGTGADVVVIDESQDVAPGASIGITARAVDALAELGVLDALLPSATVSAVPVLGNQWDGAGDPLPGPPPPQIPPRPDGLPAAVVVHRAVLARALLARAADAGVEIRRPLLLADLSPTPDEVGVRFDDGRRDTFDLVVGADGVRSQVRSLVMPDARPQYCGQMSLRVLLHDMEPGRPGFYQIPQEGEFVAVALLPGRMTYLATGVDMPSRHVGQPEARDLLRGVLDRFTAPYLTRVRDRVDETQEVIVGPYESLLLEDDWYRGRVLLVGDAAHATTPNLSSGGGMALEDGVVLGQEMSAHSSIEDGLRAFMARRRDRAGMVVRTSLELMRLSRQGGEPQQAGALRGRAMAALAQPY